MTTMSDEGERTCPLCAEEMDLTDQQLKPCKCGYEICVWCWHHIIEMAEKEGTEGRCPACRSSYDKERIVGMATKCERLVAEINGDRKQKPQKAKPKASAEARKHLSSVRVIQRNLVYIIGLPSGLADESLLEHREYFGQYGKVLKVSISRPTGGTQQASSSNTFGVYITYAKEEEAVRCIQAVHNFVLEGKPLRACFGTTKYCHAWLRNMPCSNPDCFYLHDIGSQEDSFSKDEIISAYTRSRVPQIMSNNLQRRSGNTLPQPADDFCNSGTTSAKNIIKSTANSSITHPRCSPPNGLSARSTVLPAGASWGSRASHPTSASSSCLQGPTKPIQVGSHQSSNISSMVSTANQSSAWHDDAVKQENVAGNHVGFVDVRSKPSEHLRACTDRHSQTAVTNPSAELDHTRETSAWHDDITAESKLLEHNRSSISNGRFRLLDSSKSYLGGDSQSTLLSSSTDIASVDQATSAWDDDDDDVATIPSMSKENEEVPLGRRHGNVETLNSQSSKDFGTALVNTSEYNLSDGTARTSEAAATVCQKTTSSHNSSSPATLEGTDMVQEDILSSSDVLFSKEVGSFSNGIGGLVQNSTILNGKTDSFCERLSSVNLDPSPSAISLGLNGHQTESNHIFSELSDMRKLCPENYLGHITSLPVKNSLNVLTSAHIQGESPNWSLDIWKQMSPPNMSGRLNAIQASSDGRHSTSFDVGQSYLSHDAQTFSRNHSSSTWTSNYDGTSTSANIRSLDISSGTSQLFIDDGVRFGNKHHENKLNELLKLETAGDGHKKSASEEVMNFAMLDNVSNVNKNVGVDTKENNIISDILSMDSNPWDASLPVDNNFVKLLNENDMQDASLKISSSWKGQSSSQSRFSFARQENESIFECFSGFSKAAEDNGAPKDPANGLYNGPASRNAELGDLFGYGHSVASSDKNSAVSRAKISAPPGFSAPNRAPPPGFSSQERLYPAYDTMSSGFSLVQNQYQMPLPENTGDVELIDPAILAVHKGHLPYGLNTGLGGGFPSDINVSENDLRFQFSMQPSISTHQAQIFSGQTGDGFASTRDAFYPKQFLMQNHNTLSHLNQMPFQASRNSFVSNSQWNGWNDMQSAIALDMSELSRTERRGFNSYIPTNEERKFHIPSSADLYNRSFGI